MDIRRRFLRGRLTELVGAVTLDSDRYYRSFMTTREGVRLEEVFWEATEPGMQAAIRAYTRGVNAWLEDLRAGRNGAKLPGEYGFPLVDSSRLDDWEPLDSVACILTLADDLTNQSALEMQIGAAVAQLGPAQGADFYAPWPTSSSTILQSLSPQKSKLLDLSAAQQRLFKARGLLQEAARRIPEPDRERGSNNWVIAPSRSSTGEALLANDPHLAMSNPSIWYFLNLNSKRQEGGIHIAGASFAGLPGVVLGQNEQIAWGATVAYFDMVDVYLETLSPDGEGVMLNGEVVPFIQREQRFEIHGGEDVTETFYYVPHHGPVISLDREAGQAISVRWVGHDARGDLNFFYHLWRAQNLEEARQALTLASTPGQNFVAIDRAGRIGWMPYNQVPQRPWASAELPAWLPLPGEGSAEWGPPIPLEELPQAFDPESGYIITANNDMSGALADGDPSNDAQGAFQSFVHPGYRHERLMQLMAAQEKHSLESIQSMQSDVRSLLGERMTPAILEILGDTALSPEAEQLREALSAWDFECPTGLEGIADDAPRAQGAEATASIGCTAFHLLYGRLPRLAFGDELSVAGVELMPQDEAIIRLVTEPEALQGGAAYWDDLSTEDLSEAPEAILAQAFEESAAWLVEELGPSKDDWRWGYLHRLTLRADLFSAAGVDSYDNGSYANDGGAFTVDVAAPRNAAEHQYGQRSGASMRFTCSAGVEALRCFFEHPGGQRHHPSSPHYGDGLSDWLSNQPRRLPFSPEEVEAAAVERLQVLAPE